MGEIMILISTKYSQDATKDTWKTPGKHLENTHSSYLVFTWIRDSTLTPRIVQKRYFKV